MITKKELKVFEKELKNLLNERFRHLNEHLYAIEKGNSNISKDFKIIEDKLDTFITILQRYEKQQQILEKKMQAIEDFFDPKMQN